MKGIAKIARNCQNRRDWGFIAPHARALPSLVLGAAQLSSRKARRNGEQPKIEKGKNFSTDRHGWRQEAAYKGPLIT